VLAACPPPPPSGADDAGWWLETAAEQLLLLLPAAAVATDGGGPRPTPARKEAQEAPGERQQQHEDEAGLVLVPPVSTTEPCAPPLTPAYFEGSPHRKRKAGTTTTHQEGEEWEQQQEKQLALIRRQRKEDWRRARAATPRPSSPSERSGGFDAGLWRQVKDFRARQQQKWRQSKPAGGRVMTLADLEAEARGGPVDHQSTPPGALQRAATAEERIGRECLLRTNNFRKQQGLPPLLWEDTLYKIALRHSHSAYREDRTHHGPICPD